MNTTSPEIAAFFDKNTNTFTYVVTDSSSKKCAVIDSVLDLDYASGTVNHTSADNVIHYIKENALTVEWHLETHVHADHLSAAPYLQEKLGGRIAIGSSITVVQETFGKVFNEGESFKRDGSQFDVLFSDYDTFSIGTLEGRVLHTPGHTPACMTYVIADTAFVGDTLFMPDGGTARADFPGGDAATLYDSIQKILALPDETKLYMCHDYCPNGRDVEYQTTVKAQKENNIHVNENITKSDFITMRESRDKTLGMPRLILPSLQINMDAGHFPEADTNDLVYLKVPINAFK